MTTTIKNIFRAYPEAKELYQDSKGIIWLNKNTAEAQYPGQPVTVIKKEGNQEPEPLVINTESNLGMVVQEPAAKLEVPTAAPSKKKR